MYLFIYLFIFPTKICLMRTRFLVMFLWSPQQCLTYKVLDEYWPNWWPNIPKHQMHVIFNALKFFVLQNIKLYFCLYFLIFLTWCLPHFKTLVNIHLLSWFFSPLPLSHLCIPKPSTVPVMSSCSKMLGEAGVGSVRVIVTGTGCLAIYSLKVPSARGMEDPSHPNTLSNQGIIFLHCLLCLEDPHINALFLKVFQSWWGHLGRRKKMSKSGGKAPPRASFLQN